MKIINVHQRVYNQPSEMIWKILETLSSKEDRLWPREIWPPVVLNNGLAMNSSGGHGPIRYYVSKHDHGEAIEFTFTKPAEFVGFHKFEIIENSNNTSVLRHILSMNVNLKGLVAWYFAIKWLHDALLEDCLDKVNNQLSDDKAHSPHNFWVRRLRKMLGKRTPK